jgi:hypothetical protein
VLHDLRQASQNAVVPLELGGTDKIGEKDCHVDCSVFAAGSVRKKAPDV